MDVDRCIKDYVSKKVKPIFEKVLKETPKNRVSVGEVGFRRRFVYYQPHNCRLYFDYIKPSKPTYKGSVVVKNSSELMFKEDFMGCKVIIKKHQIEIINKIDVERRYRVFLDNCNEEVINIISKKVHEGVLVLRELIKRFGGSSRFELKNLVVQDNKVEGDSFVDSIPLQTKFRNKVVKKVYGEHNVEFSDPSFFANYLSNMALLTKDLSVVRWAEDNISCLGDVFRLEPVICLMSEVNRLKLSDFLFKRFGGC